MTLAEQVFLITAGVSSCLNVVLQIIRSRERRNEAVARTKEIAERRAFQQWLFDHGQREEQATTRLIEKHEELAEAVRSVTPIQNPKMPE